MYYLSINVTNELSGDAELKWEGLTGEEQLIVWKNSAKLKEVAVTGETAPKPYRIRAFERGTTTLLELNNADYIDVPLQLSKETVNLRVSKGKVIFMILNTKTAKFNSTQAT